MKQHYFIYTASGTNEQVTRDEAIAVIRRTHGLVVRIHPGANPVAVEIRQLAGIVFRPVAKIGGYGWSEAPLTHRYGLALVEAAALIEEAEKLGRME